MKKVTQKVLVLGVDERSTLTVIRSLGRKGLIVHLGYDETPSIGRYSKFVEKYFKFPHAGKEPELWINYLSNIIKKDQYDLVIPTSDNYLVLAVKNRRSLERHAKFAIPSNKGFEYTYKKNKTLDLAKSLSIPIPKTKLINKISELTEIRKEFSYPVIVKPISSKVWNKGRRYSLKVEIAKDKAQLKSKLQRLLEICPVLLQSFHSGVGIGIEMLMSNGDLVAAFQHQRIHEPIKGGGSSYRKSVKINSSLLNFSVKIMQALNWTGVAMVEFKYNKKTQESVLMEINGRFWGSLPLAYNSGVDFPAFLYDLIVFNKYPNNVKYRENLFCRNITRDFDWFVENLITDKADPLKISVPVHTVFKEMGNLLRFNERFDTIALDDMKPGIIHLSGYLVKKTYGLLTKTKKLMHRINHEYNVISLSTIRRHFIKQIKKNPNILFICKGNICRSPFAAHYLKNKLKQRQVTYINVESSGLINKTNRKSPETAIEAAMSFRVDLLQHRSKVLNRDIVGHSGILFVMDTDLFNNLTFTYPKHRKKILYTGQMQKGYPKKIEIKDPYGKDLKSYTFIYEQIVRSIDGIMDTLFKS